MKNPNNPEVDKALKDADIVIIPAGVPRKPGTLQFTFCVVNSMEICFPKKMLSYILRNKMCLFQFLLYFTIFLMQKRNDQR